MKTPPSSRLRALRVMECSSQSPILYELLVFFPTIEFLATGIEIVAPPPKVPAKFKLYELTMFRTLTPEIFSWLLANSLDTLRIVELRDLPSAEVTAVLVGCGHQLQSFRAMKYHTNTAKIVQSCTNLQELVILGIPSIPPFTIQRLPLTLEHLSLVHSHSDPSVGIADMMMLVKNSSKLKLLSCDGRFKRDPLYGVFHDICMKKGIEVESSEYGLWPNEEPVKAFNFPRGRTMLNLRAMN
ncbi:hypothetical protein BDP27DRAFT_1208342 [Rhodocollybia butyracea]|uniref:FBD domain-containing protein n=1 Tax=Rhodocollybia butyracea TaxID=206335 RepID=A0A9P5UGT2_9AGAR|nr:hypothetical protein BDP27DRAFT_1208342 [Rhodocollybia butyracea]